MFGRSIVVMAKEQLLSNQVKIKSFYMQGLLA